jgi:hypothetical protein
VTPADHIARAENILRDTRDLGNEWDKGERISMTLAAIGDALVAIAIELGAPHQADTTAPAGNG